MSELIVRKQPYMLFLNVTFLFYDGIHGNKTRKQTFFSIV